MDKHRRQRLVRSDPSVAIRRAGRAKATCKSLAIRFSGVSPRVLRYVARSRAGLFIYSELTTKGYTKANAQKNSNPGLGIYPLAG